MNSILSFAIKIAYVSLFMFCYKLFIQTGPKYEIHYILLILFLGR